MVLPIFIVDSFTIAGKAFSGNPAGVCLLEYDDEITDEQKQGIAKEINAGATAFVSHGWTHGKKLPTEERSIRWFSPGQELTLCGHGTLAAVKIILDEGLLKDCMNIIFHSKNEGQFGVSVEQDGTILLNFPSNPPHKLNRNEHPWLDGEIIQNTVGSEDMVDSLHYSPNAQMLLIRIKDQLSKEGLRAVKPNFHRLMETETGGSLRGIIVTVIGHVGCRKPLCPYFYSRVFMPWVGINEDHVCGRAHTVLTPYWAKELGNKGPLYVQQVSERGGDLVVTLDEERVTIKGQASIVMKGRFQI